MKRRPLFRILPSRLFLLVAPLVAAWPAHRVVAQTNGTFTNLNGGGWGATGNWSGGTIAAGADAIADISTLNITAARAISLDGNRTVGSLIFRDATTVSHDWSLVTGTGGTLNLDVTAGTPSIQVLNRTATISAVLAGNDGLTVSSAPTGTTGGTLVLSAANTLSGGVTLTGGILQLNNNAAAGSNIITIAPSTNTGIANRLQILGGVAIPNDIVINGGHPVAGNGVIQQAGTGRAVVNGTVTINAGAGNGGHLRGGGAVGSELVLAGPINAAVSQISQRDGRVVYAGGGSGANNIIVTGTAIIGQPGGLQSGLNVQLNGSQNATLELGANSQTIGDLSLGNSGAANNVFQGIVNLGTGTLTVNGQVQTLTNGTGGASHLITGSAGSLLSFGGNPAILTVADGVAAPDDLTIAANVQVPGGLTKTGPGTLSLDGVQVQGPVTVTQGTLAVGRFNALGGASVASLQLDSGVTAAFKAGPAGVDALATNGLTSAGAAVNIVQNGGILAPGTYPLITYTGATPGLAGFALTPFGHATASLVDTGSAIALNVAANDRLTWGGSIDGTWDTAVQNWALQSAPATPATFAAGDEVVFGDGPLNTTINLTADVTPSRVSFNNGPGTTYSLNGSAIIGIGDVVKAGTGTAVLANQNRFTGSVAVNAGTLVLDHSVATGNNVLTAASVVNVAPAATLRLIRNDVATGTAFTFSRPLSGSGTVSINPRSDALAVNSTAIAVFMSAASPSFTGGLVLESPTVGTYRLQQPAAANLGSASITVQDRAQLYTAAGQTYNNAITITGTGYQDANGFLGALRIENGGTWAGPVAIAGTGRITSHNGTGTVSGPISGGTLEANISNYNNGYTLILTGENSYGETIIGGQNTQTAGVPSYRLNVGNGGTTGTLGLGNVTVNGDGANGVLGFDRADGYTLRAGQTITGGGTNVLRTFVDLDVRGTGFNDNGSSITLGGGEFTTGGSIRVGQSRTDASATLTGTHTAGQLVVGTANNAVLNLNSGANLNIGYVNIGNAAGAAGTVNQAAGTTLTVANQFRVGHWPRATSVYNLNGGTITLTGDSPFNSPSTAGGGGANATGDNNIEAAATNQIVGGGIYLGNDGHGIFNHNSGSVTTNWIVLDNRGNSVDGIDQYNLNSGTLTVRSTWGIIGRNVGTALNLAGGTVRVGNNGTGNGTGPDLNIPLNVDIDVRSTGSTLDTNGAGNAFTLNRSVTGSGSLALSGGGRVVFDTAGVQLVSPTVSSAAGTTLVKQGVGTTTLTGSAAGLNGAVDIQAGRLNLPTNATPSAVTVATGATLGGKPTIGTLNLNGGTVCIDPNAPGALTVGTLNATGANLIELASIPTSATPIQIISYTTRTPGGTLEVAGAANFRSLPVVTDSGTSPITLTLAPGKTVAWTGAASAVWDVNNSINWVDTAPPNGAEKFYNADIAAFRDGAVNNFVSLSGVIQPLGVVVSNDTTDYTLTSTDGNQLSGPAGITKSGAASLTLAGPNLHSGRTTISGGTLSIAAANSLGNGASTNAVTIENGGRLSFTAATDLLPTRTVEVGAGGGTLAVTNAAAQVVSIPGDVVGAGALTITSGGAGNGVVLLGGNNTAYSGDVTVSTPSGVGTATLRLGSSTAVNTGTLFVRRPESGTAGAANGLDLNGFALPATTVLDMNAEVIGTTSYRTQVIGGQAGGAINGPIRVSGNSIVQFSCTANNGLSINGPVTEGVGGFNAANSVFFLRGGSGIGNLNGTVTLPAATVSKTDAGTWVINSTGNSWANTGVAVGTLRMGVANALPPGVVLTFGQNDGNAATLDLNGFSQTIGSLRSNPVAGNLIGNKTITSAAPATLTVNQADNTNYGGLMTGALSLQKSGPGTLTLSSAAGLTHTGNNTVDGGILELRTALTASGVTVSAGGTLSGTGSAAGASTVASGGIVSPGPGTAMLTFRGNLTMAPGGIYDAEITGLGNVSTDKIDVVGSFEAGGTVRVTLSGYTPAAGDAFDLVDATTTTGSPTFDFAAAALPAGLSWDTSAFASTGVIRVITTPSDAFSAWATTNGVTGGKGGDDDRDGVSNLMEFATNSDPKAGGSLARTFPKVHSLGGGNVLTLTVATRKNATFAAAGARQNATVDAVLYSVEASNDLATWDSVTVTELAPADAAAVQATLSLPTLGADWEWHTFRTDGTTAVDASDSIRLKVTAQ